VRLLVPTNARAVWRGVAASGGVWRRVTAPGACGGGCDVRATTVAAGHDGCRAPRRCCAPRRLQRATSADASSAATVGDWWCTSSQRGTECCGQGSAHVVAVTLKGRDFAGWSLSVARGLLPLSASCRIRSFATLKRANATRDARRSNATCNAQARRAASHAPQHSRDRRSRHSARWRGAREALQTSIRQQRRSYSRATSMVSVVCSRHLDVLGGGVHACAGRLCRTELAHSRRAEVPRAT
jgi:hypothetical protein